MHITIMRNEEIPSSDELAKSEFNDHLLAPD